MQTVTIEDPKEIDVIKFSGELLNAGVANGVDYSPRRLVINNVVDRPEVMRIYNEHDALAPVVLSTEEVRKREYERRGATFEKMLVALWEAHLENKPEAAAALQAIREAVKNDFPSDAAGAINLE